MNKKLKFGGRTEKHKVDLGFLPGLIRWIVEIVLVCLLAFGFVWYFGHRVSNIGDSMSPVLKNGDGVLVNRMVYDAKSPSRGDLIVFRPKGNENLHSYIKRVIGLPGETIHIDDGKVYIDGKLFEADYLDESIDAGLASVPITLEANEFFVLGDNSSSSEDSRNANIGNVKRGEIEGKAWFILSPIGRLGFIK